MSTTDARARREAAAPKGSPGHQLWPERDVRPGDQTVRRYRFSAFLPGASDLPKRLRANGFDTVLIAGLVTNLRCETSARVATMMNLRTILASEANAALPPAEHCASSLGFYSMFGHVTDAGLVLANLARGAGEK